MKPFLKYVAEDWIARGLNLSETAIVFPNKRASVFFDKHLADILQQPFDVPNYSTINELWQQFSSLQIADSILLNSTLYKVYKQFVKTDETFDEFYFWGELLLRDFDDLDKHLVDAQQLFQNIQQIKDIDNPLQYLTAEQIQTLNQFFVHFDTEKSTKLKEKFIQIWSVLHDIYTQFGQTLKSQNLAYEGLLVRDVVENDLSQSALNLPYKNYVFVGFNVLNTAEETLFTFFKNTQNALFYWDYDQSFLDIPHHEAGIFIQRNLKNFENALQNPAVFNSFETSRESKKITFVASPTENAQTRYANEWLKAFKNGNAENSENAIVLCNEQLLIPLISALSDENTTNITMGYPVKQTPIANRVQQFLLSTDSTKSPTDVLLELIGMLEADLKSAATAHDPLYQEATFRVVSQLHHIVDLMRNHTLDLSQKSLQRVVDRMLSALTIPFLGEPVPGTQIMGVLETRNLDFKHVMMLSVNEGMLPKAANDGSFIPYAFRKAFGMTIPEHQTAVYAYYFFRLMQRAENIALVYHASAESEKSRFMLQLMIENGFKIQQQIHLQTLFTPPVELQQSRKIEIPTTPEIRNFLLKKYGKDAKNQGLSPSAINVFLTCKLKFYLRYVAGLEAPKPETANMDAATMGTWFHRSAEILYRKIANQLTIDEKKAFVEFSESLINTEQLEIYNTYEKCEQLVDEAFIYEKFLHQKSLESMDWTAVPEYSGGELIARRLLRDNLKRLISLDIQKTPFALWAMEKKISEIIEVDDLAIKIGGYVDRMDNIDGYLRIVDYKTGGSLKMLKIDKLQDLFDEKNISKNRNYLQALIYGLMVSKTSGSRRILPCLLHIHEAYKSDYSPAFLPNDFNEISAEFENLLMDVLRAIFSLDTSFCATERSENCRYCDYLELCRKMT